MTEKPMGCSALLRVSGCPVRFWLAAANTDLFDRIHRLNCLEEQYALLGRRLAAHIGNQLVPKADLSADERHRTLRLRRQLHQGVPVNQENYKHVTTIAARVFETSHPLIKELEQAGSYSQRLMSLESETARIGVEEGKTRQTAWELIHTSSVAERMLSERNAAVYRTILKAQQHGVSWESKKLRQHGDYLWRMLERASTRSTPRDWHAHVALLSITVDAPSPPSIVVSGLYATSWMENIYQQRCFRASLQVDHSVSKTCVSLTALREERLEHLQFWIMDPDIPGRLVDVSMRRTELLNSIYSYLRLKPAPVEALENFMRTTHSELRCEDTRAFIEHLVQLGVLEVRSPPQGRLTSWHQIPSQSFDAPASRSQSSVVEPESVDTECDQVAGYFDVYRKANGPLPASAVARIDGLVRQALRVLALIHADMASVVTSPMVRIGDSPEPVMGIARKIIEADTTFRQPVRQNSGWPKPTADDSPYSRLVHWLVKAGDSSEPIDINTSVLDMLGAPKQDVNWPLDCLLRIPDADAEFDAVLDGLFPAGILDARFLSTLSRLHPHVPHASAYQRFLKCIEQTSGTPLVEILVPPFSEIAANAVKRPLYTDFWTGDADIDAYCEITGSTPVYIPLDTITLRRSDHRLVAEAGGRRIFPVFHATRVTARPWNILVNLLTAATPRPMRWHQRSLHHPSEAFSDMEFVPRIVVGGKLVLSTAEWRIPLSEFWGKNASGLSKARILERLRRRRRLPRWLFVWTQLGVDPLACDLESVRSIHILEQAASVSTTSLVVTEMLPTPDQLLVKDHTCLPNDRVVSELMIRLPCNESAGALANRIAQNFS